MERTGADVDEFLASLGGPHAETMRTLDALISERLGGRERELWEGVFWGGTEQRIIGYARIEQPRPKGESVEWFLLGLAQYQGRLGSVKQGAAALTIPSLEKVNLEGLSSLVDEAFATLE